MSNTVKVSTRMSVLVDDLVHATHDQAPQSEYVSAKEALLSEIATLEAKVETTERVLWNHINELLVQIASHPYPVKETPVYDVDLSDYPLGDLLEGNPLTSECARCRKMVLMGAHTCRPQTPALNNDPGYLKKPADALIAQTLGEEIPLKVNCAQCGKILTGPPFIAEQDVSFCRIQCAEEYGTVPSNEVEDLPHSTSAEMPESVKADVDTARWCMAYEDVPPKLRTIDWLAQDRSRLLTALDEKGRQLQVANDHIAVLEDQLPRS